MNRDWKAVEWRGETKNKGCEKISLPQLSPKSMTPNETRKDKILKKPGGFNLGIGARIRCKFQSGLIRTKGHRTPRLDQTYFWGQRERGQLCSILTLNL